MSIAISPKTVGLTLVSLALATTAHQPVLATSVTRNFIATVTDGLYTGQSGSGSFTYDDTNVFLNIPTLLTPNGGLSLTFSFLGQFYTASNDVNYLSSPGVYFESGSRIYLDYNISETDSDNPTSINEPGIISLGIFAELIDNNNDGILETTLNVIQEAAPVSVPEHSSVLAILGVGILGIGSIFKDRLRTK